MCEKPATRPVITNVLRTPSGCIAQYWSFIFSPAKKAKPPPPFPSQNSGWEFKFSLPSPIIWPISVSVSLNIETSTERSTKIQIFRFFFFRESFKERVGGMWEVEEGDGVRFRSLFLGIPFLSSPNLFPNDTMQRQKSMVPTEECMMMLCRSLIKAMDLFVWYAWPRTLFKEKVWWILVCEIFVFDCLLPWLIEVVAERSCTLRDFPDYNATVLE